MSGREQLLQQVRSVGRGSRGAPPAILELPDSALYEVFDKMKRGLSDRAIARHLQKIGMHGTENCLQQTVSLLRKRIAPLLTAEMPAIPFPQNVVKLPAEVSCLYPDEMLSTITEICNNYGESIRKATQAAAQRGTGLSEDTSKHVKAFSALVATKARLEQTVIKSSPTEPIEDPSLQERADRVWEFLTENGRDSHKMINTSVRPDR